MESVPQAEKKTLPQAIHSVSKFVCVTAHTDQKDGISVAGFGNVNPIPFRQLEPPKLLTFKGLSPLA